MTDKIILVKSDDTTFQDQVFLVVSFKTHLDLLGYTARITIENATDVMKKFEVHNNAFQIDFDKTITSTLEIGTHRANIKLYDTFGRTKTVHNFEIEVKNEFDIHGVPFLNEYEMEIVIDDEGINKYKNYNELHNKPSIQGVELKGDKSFQDLGIDRFAIGISNKGINDHDTSNKSHEDIREQLANKQEKLIAGANITIIDGIISSLGAEGGITTDYEALGHKPIINGVSLNGSITLDELGVQPKGEYVTEEILEQKGYLTTIPTGYVTEEELEAENFLKEVPETYFTDEQNELKYETIENVSKKQDILTAGNNIEITTDDENPVISAIIPDEYITSDELEAKDYVNNTTLTTRLSKKQATLLAGNNIRLTSNTDGTYTISAIDSKNPKDIVSYNALNNKPSINGIALLNNKTSQELGLQPLGNYQEKLTVGENIDISKNEEEQLVIKAIIPDEYITENELSVILDTKANWGNKLSDYEISDAYTKEEIQELLQEKVDYMITDIITSSNNNIISYTENSITAKKDLVCLASNGIINGAYNNTEIKLEDNITIDTTNLMYENFYIALVKYNTYVELILIPKNEFKIICEEKIPNTQTGYIKNLFNNKYYYMSNVGHGIYEPIPQIMKIIGEGSKNIENNKIKSVQQYIAYNVVNQDILNLQLKQKQDNLTFGENFEVKDNNVNFNIPFNYVTKEYLIENDYAVKVDIYDAVEGHDLNTLSHQDIRQEIENVKQNISQNYVTLSRYNNLLNKYNELNELVQRIIEKNNLKH